jgi:L-alanine-DL-glutamate epimerase-like enolase superfamily enzyme
MVDFCRLLARAWSEFDVAGHPIEIGHQFMQTALPTLRQLLNDGRDPAHCLPFLAALVCLSPFDIALHDAYGVLHDVPIYETYHGEWMNRDLSWYLEPADGTYVDFRGLYPKDFFPAARPNQLAAWHLVAGLDPLDSSEANGSHITDGLPVILGDWIEHDGLFCLKIKLRGDDSAWDYDRLVRVGRIALKQGIRHLSADFNCTVRDPEYVNAILDNLSRLEPDIDRLLLYVEQPFPYELEDHPIDVRSVAARKPLYMDESAHSWRQIRVGRALGWSGVALKTCKTQTGAILSLCWAKAHGMEVMVQDLTNPMLAQISHVQLAAYAGTVMGVETNAMQFYPHASAAEAAIHPGLYSRGQGHVDLSTMIGPGIGYNGAELVRDLPAPAASYGVIPQSIIPRWHAG